jgi:2-haloacid dehalogenase
MNVSKINVSIHSTRQRTSRRRHLKLASYWESANGRVSPHVAEATMRIRLEYNAPPGRSRTAKKHLRACWQHQKVEPGYMTDEKTDRHKTPYPNQPHIGNGDGLRAPTASTAQTESMTTKNAKSPKVIFFDVNETLLDLTPLKESITKVLDGHGELVGLWFSTMLHYSLVDTLTGKYHTFPEIGVAALQMVAEGKGIELSKQEAEQAIIPVFAKLPPYPDVIDGLKVIKNQGFLLVSLTNSPDAGVKKQFENAGLIDIFDQRLTVDGIQKFKPDLEVYRWALMQMEAKASEAMLVAAHGWDIAGAKSAGLQTVFIARPGKVPYPLTENPDHIVKDINELASLLTAPFE